jgi:hypothetical protein
MTTVCKMLGQARLTNTDVYSLYSPPDGKQAIIRNIMLCNTSFSDVTYTLFHDDDGQIYLDSTTLYKNVTILEGATLTLDLHICMNNKNGNLAVRCNTPNALTVTAYGMEI